MSGRDARGPLRRFLIPPLAHPRGERRGHELVDIPVDHFLRVGALHASACRALAARSQNSQRANAAVVATKVKVASATIARLGSECMAVAPFSPCHGTPIG